MEETVTLKNLLLHAKRYGTEGILDHARELDWSRTELVELLKGLDELTSRKPVLPVTYKRKRLTPEQRIDRYLGDEEEGTA